MGDATEALAEYLGPALGGLLSATLGNAPEIIISVFALRRGLVDIVKSSLTGSIIGNLLLGLGLSMIAGGLKVKMQSFNSRAARVNGALLVLAAFGLIVPAIYGSIPAGEKHPAPWLSLEISVILFLVYLSSLVFTLVTHKAVVGKAGVKAEKKEQGEPTALVDEPEVLWSRNKALGVLAAVAIALAFMSEILTDAVGPAADRMGLTTVFAGVFVLAIVGNAAELLNAIRFARRDKMDLAIGITVGASTQVALLVAPILVFAGIFLGQDMNLLFTRLRDVGSDSGGLVHEETDLGRRIDLARWYDARRHLPDAGHCLLPPFARSRERALIPIRRLNDVVVRLCLRSSPGDR